MSKLAHNRARTHRKNLFFSPLEGQCSEPAIKTVSGALPCSRLAGGPRQWRDRIGEPSEMMDRLTNFPAKFTSRRFQSGASQSRAAFARLNPAATRHCVPSRNLRNLVKTNDRAPFYPSLNRGVGVPRFLASLTRCFRKTRHTMQSNRRPGQGRRPERVRQLFGGRAEGSLFQIKCHTLQSNSWPISLKTNDGRIREVTHKSRIGLPVSTASRVWEIRRRSVGRGFNPAINDPLVSLPLALLHPRELRDFRSRIPGSGGKLGCRRVVETRQKVSPRPSQNDYNCASLQTIVEEPCV